MSEQLPVYEKAITTHRSAEKMVRVHGFRNVVQLAESLPENAKVLDVGAGASPFGNEVAALRPDITWVNFDYSYYDKAILKEVTKNSPANVQHVAGDATKLTRQYRPQTFDRVFSYWLLPHLSLEDPEPAKAAAQGIFRVTKTGGLASVGPRVGRSRLITLRSRPAYRTIKESGAKEQSFVNIILKETTLKGKARRLQKLANNVATPFFGTTRYAIRKGRIHHIYHPEGQEYVFPLSPKGLRTMASLTLAVAKHITRKQK